MKNKKLLKVKKDFKRDLKESLKDYKNGNVETLKYEDIEEWVDNLSKKGKKNKTD